MGRAFVPVAIVSSLVFSFTCSYVTAASELAPSTLDSQLDAQANSGTGHGTAEKQPELEEVIVTAQKRAERLQNVPISVAVFDEKAMQQKNVYDLGDIANLTPGVDFATTAGSTKNSIFIRGIASGQGYPPVAIYIDDTPIQSRVTDITGGNLTPLVFDLERVEVLRGPQGTLFGAGAEGGLIRFITPQPDLENFSGFARARIEYTKDGALSYEGGVALGGPIVNDVLAFRISAWHRREGGYIDHESAVPGGYDYSNSNWRDMDVVRAAITFSPISMLKIEPALLYQHVYQNDADLFDPATSASYPSVFTQYWASLNPRYTRGSSLVDHNILPTWESDRFSLPSLKIELDTGPVNVISNTSFFHSSSLQLSDFSPVIPDIFGLGWPTNIRDAAPNYDSSAQNIFAQEIRAQSAIDGPLQWTVGLAYTKSRQYIEQLYYDANLAGQVVAAGFPSVQDVFGQGLLPGGIGYLGLEPNTVDEQKAVFGQITYNFYGPFSVVAGLRVAHNSTSYDIYQDGPIGGPAGFNTSGKQSQHVTDPKIGLNVQLNANQLLYVSATKGDRIGGVNPPLAVLPACAAALAEFGIENGLPLTYQADSVWSYEVGSKNRLGEGRVQMDWSGFYIKWNNVQQTLTVPACSTSFTTNLGKAVSKGFEFESNFLVTENLKLGLDLGYTDARNTVSLTSGLTPSVVNGEQTNPYSAPWIVAPTAEYTFTVGQYRPYVRLVDTYHSRNPGPYQASLPSQPNYNATFIPNPAYNRLDVHVGATWDRWDISLYGTNVLNSLPLLDNQSLYPHGGAPYTLRPLTIGMAANYRW